ncbi:N-(5'-phosphoribosyl)anthranilate isomerase [candidate division KSB1 bacterium]|nr:N-(5'-phosphoribosyl)anthranilate isomerase [candidate division KSB1 bacterium]
MWLKLCGCTNEKDAEVIAHSGADAIGFIFAASPRQIDVPTVRRLSQIAKGVMRVGVFVDESIETIKFIRQTCQLDAIQLHGHESPGDCRQLGGTIIKGFRLKEFKDFEQMNKFPMAWRLLVDSFVPGKAGGTGKRIKTELISQIPNPDRVIVAGGVNSDNVQNILDSVYPFGLDTSSGIEKSPGFKDEKKIRHLVSLIKG